MKTLKTLLLATVLTTGAAICGCGARQDAAAYNNRLMTLMNANEQDMTAMNTAMTAHDYRKAEQVRKDWVQDLSDALRQAMATESFRGDDSLKAAVVGGLTAYRKIVSQDYRELIAARTANDSAAAAREPGLLSRINDGFERAGSAINEAADRFQESYGR
jgi:hypothetical protein